MTTNTQVDETRDTMDGVHLNIRGAEKVSAFLGQYLLDTVPGIRRGENAQFESQMGKYTQLRDIALLESETDFLSYLQYLTQNLDRWSVAVLGTGDFVHGLGESEFAAMQALGFEKAASARPHENYAAVLDRGTLLFETVSDHLINVNQGLSNKVYLTLTAASKYDVAVEEKSTSLALSNAGTYPGKQGMNFLVWDNATGLPLDCRNFDTTTVDKTYSGNGNQITGFLRAYESAVCFAG